jgi:hypothetical protein
MSTAIVPINAVEIEQRAPNVAEQARAIEVKDQASYLKACEYLRDVVTRMIDEVHSAYDSIVAAAHKAHSEACAKRKQYLDPLEKAKAELASKIGTWELEQRRIQEDAERAAREAAEVELATSLETEIEDAEARGASPEEVRAIIEQPQVLPRTAPPPTYERAVGVSTRKTYKCEVSDMKALCRAIGDGKVPANLVLPNEAALNARARADGPEMARFVPGIRVVEVSSVATRRTR